MMLDHHNLHLLLLVKELRNPFMLKLWLFIAYVVSFVSLAASVGLLIQDALGKSGPSAWTGVAAMAKNSSENGKSIKLFGFEITTMTTTTSSDAAIISEKDFMGRKIKKGNRWTEDEHRAFLKGLDFHGKGSWTNIAKDFVPTRTSTQVASHAQKYFVRLLDANSNERKSARNQVFLIFVLKKQSILKKKQRILYIKLLFHWEIIKKVSKKVIMFQVLYQIT
ncbi:hypothetical protein H5410_055570 [Solanum commersonii]|uniref:Uncharacterized protein n=1 Tax=Solanum commersonii TaxID=4109 RepID=A0A9J5WJR5_SOLCO|nr:hypothetical protein H5410_055570 [Solanum commersonii]